MFEFLHITYQSHSASFTSEYFPLRTLFWLFDCKWLSYDASISFRSFKILWAGVLPIPNLSAILRCPSFGSMVFGVIYQLNSLLKVQAFTLFCGFLFCTTMTFQARFTCLQAVLSDESGVRSVKRWFFCCSIFAAGLRRHTKSHFRTSFPVRCFFKGRNRTFRSVTY